MGPPRAKPSAIAERLAAVERELQRLQAEKRRMERAIRRAAPPSAVPSPLPSGSAVPTRPAPAQPPQPELFNTKPPTPTREEKPSPAAEHRLPPHKDRRFASYFSVGGIEGVHPLHQERRIQRNKAIAMVIFAAILLLWVISLVF